MNNTSWLTDLNVTQEELDRLKGNNTIFAGLPHREQEIILAAKPLDLLMVVCADNSVAGPARGDAIPGMCYRLAPSVQLPKPEPSNRDTTNYKPFPYEVDGETVLCCPVFVHEGEYNFRRPDDPLIRAWLIRANGFPGFRGLMTADENGWPEFWCGAVPRDRYDVSLCLARQPDGGEQIAFACFRKGGE